MARTTGLVLAIFGFALIGTSLQAEDLAGQVKKAVEKSTLDQPGTKPFHLKATFAPSQVRDAGSNRVGDIEIWWQSPTQWRREVRSPEFHQIFIVNGDRQWQKNDGDYFPDWLRELAEAIVRPIPLSADDLAKRVKSAQVRHLVEQTNIDWDPSTEFGNEQANGKGVLSMKDKTGLLFYTGGPGFGGLYDDFKDFHGRKIATTIASGFLEVTAKITLLEDLNTTPNGLFDAAIPGGDSQPIDTVVLSEEELRRNLLPSKQFAWPALSDGPLEGVVWTTVVLDRTGKIREIDPSIADNPGVKNAADEGFRAMQFRPFLRNGIPVQARGRISISFKAVRPAATENFDSAKNYFERGRKASFLAAGASSPYHLRAEFEAGTTDGVKTGFYEDTWISSTDWRREAWFGSSHLVKSQSGDQRYLVVEGNESNILRMVMLLLEPIPAEDTMTESDWRIRRDSIGSLRTIRVFRGPEGPNGEFDPKKSQGYWFDEKGYLVKSYTSGFEVRPSDEEEYNGVRVARHIDAIKDGKLGMRVTIKEIGPTAAGKDFKMKGHGWQRAFSAEVR